MDLKSIEENYKNYTTDKLITLAKEPNQLRSEVIPLLQKELMTRGRDEEALRLNNLTTDNVLSLEDVKLSIKERIAAMEPIESIKLDLKDQNIDILELFQDDLSARKEIINYYSTLQKEGLTEQEIDQKLQETYSIDNSQGEVLKSDIKNGGASLPFGIALFLIGVFFLVQGFCAGHSLGKLSLLPIFGLWMIVKALRKKKN